MVNFGYPYNDLVICKDSTDYLITVKDLSKLVIGSFYRPPDKGIQPLVDLEMELAQISEKFKNNSHFGR